MTYPDPNEQQEVLHKMSDEGPKQLWSHPLHQQGSYAVGLDAVLCKLLPAKEIFKNMKVM